MSSMHEAFSSILSTHNKQTSTNLWRKPHVEKRHTYWINAKRVRSTKNSRDSWVQLENRASQKCLVPVGLKKVIFILDQGKETTRSKHRAQKELLQLSRAGRWPSRDCSPASLRALHPQNLHESQAGRAALMGVGRWRQISWQA